MVARLNLLLISASDSSGGSGLQADLRVCVAHDMHPLSVVTAVTAQSPTALRAAFAVPGAMIAAQLEAMSRLPIAAVKIGALPNAEVARAVVAWLRGREIPVVVDPVLATSGGDSLTTPEAREVLSRELIPLAALATPNGPEFEALTGVPGDSGPRAVAAARELLSADGALLLKGGHAAEAMCEDVLISRTTTRSFSHPRVAGLAVRGTGCALATACAAGLARGLPMVQAVEQGIEYVQRALRNSGPLGEGVAAL